FFGTHPVRPRPTLFPYTTLFRSREGRQFGGEAGDVFRREAELARLARGVDLDQHVERPVLDLEAALQRLGDAQAVERLELGGEADRKSTRLNSSHVKISYAVFCL